MIVSIFVDKELYLTGNIEKKHLIWMLLIIFLSINLFGTMYSFAAIPMVWLITVYGIWKQKKLFKNQAAIAGAYLLSIFV